MPINELIARGFGPTIDQQNQKIQNAIAMGRSWKQGQVQDQDLQQRRDRLAQERDISNREYELRKSEEDRKKEVFELSKLDKVLGEMIDTAPFVKFADYPAWKENLESKGLPKGKLKDPQYYQMTGDPEGAWKQEVAQSIPQGKYIKEKIEQQIKMRDISSKENRVVGKSLVGPTGVPLYTEPKGPSETKFQSDIGKLVEDKRVLMEERGYAADNQVIKAIDDEIKKKSKTEEKEVNMPMWYDSMGAKKLGKAYQTKAGRDAFADWVADPKNEKEVDAFQQKYTEQNTPKTVTVLQTGTGFQPYTSKGPGVGTVGPTIEGAGKPFPNDVTSQLSTIKNTVGRINDLELRSKDLKGQFGPIEGRWTTLRQKLVANGPTQELMNEMSGLITMAYALSGKQISYQEMEMLKSAILPTINQPYQNFLATVNMSRKWLVSQHNDTLKYYEDTGHSSKLKPLELPNGDGGKDLKSLSNDELLKSLEK